MAPGMDKFQSIIRSCIVFGQSTHSRNLVRVSAQSGQSLCCLHESDFQSSISLSICPFEDSLLLF